MVSKIYDLERHRRLALQGELRQKGTLCPLLVVFPRDLTCASVIHQCPNGTLGWVTFSNYHFQIAT